MLTGIVILFAIILFVVLPVAVLKKYYRFHGLSLKSILWVLLTILTWPLVPVGVAYIKTDKILLSLFWVAFLFFTVACSYWLVLNVNEFIAVQNFISQKLGSF